MTQQRIDSIFQGDYGVRCAAIIGNDDDRLRWSTSSAIWCRKPATHATVGNPDLGVNPLNVIHSPPTAAGGPRPGAARQPRGT
jgi:hypothetical protein